MAGDLGELQAKLQFFAVPMYGLRPLGPQPLILASNSVLDAGSIVSLISGECFACYEVGCECFAAHVCLLIRFRFVCELPILRLELDQFSLGNVSYSVLGSRNQDRV